MPSTRPFLTLSVFAAAGIVSFGTATGLATSAERLTRSELQSALSAQRLEWVQPEFDGLTVRLSGTAPDEGARILALRVAAEVVGAGRLSETITVPRTVQDVTPAFRIEVMRNNDDVSVVGLVPEGDAGFLSALAGISRHAEVADMLQSAAHPAPAGWDPALAFAVEALRRLPVAQVSVSLERIDVHGLVESAEDRQRLIRELRDLAPAEPPLTLDLVAPRPVIAPFLLRVSRDGEGTRIEACAADTEMAQQAIDRAVRSIGYSGRFRCTVGLGSPSPRWGQAADRSIAALGRLPGGELTMSDDEVQLVGPHDMEREAFDRVIGRLESELPAPFTVSARLMDPPADAGTAVQELPEFVVNLTSEGAMTLTGRLPDPMIRDAVGAYARAHFGMEAVSLETRLDETLPEGWSVRALAVLEAMTQLAHGRAMVRAERIELTGASGNEDASSEIATLLAGRLGSTDGISLRISYDEELDPQLLVPSPENCVTRVARILTEQKPSFAPGSARLNDESNAALDQIAAVLSECGELPLEVAGYTDSQGREATNLALSQSRAEAVIAALMGRRVLVGSMVARGYGAENPIADNATEEGREANRRIEIRLILPEVNPEDLDETARADAEAELVFEALQPYDGQTRPRARPTRSQN